MKRFFITLLIMGIINVNTLVFATEGTDSPTASTIHNDAPKWEEYVAPKYRDPHATTSRAVSINQVVWGGVFTSLIITCPIGIPLLICGTQNLKMSSYENRKNIFDKEIEKAQLIQNDGERRAEYKKILNRCNLKESTREHYAKKEGRTLSY